MKKGSKSCIKVGVSACLVGQKVRFDADHRLHPYITDILARHLDLVPVCPEVEAGMDVPREPVRLEGEPEAPRMIEVTSRTDWTRRMNVFCARRISQPDIASLSGFILKRNSPSCGMKGVKVFDDAQAPRRCGRGLFAARLLKRYPLLPVEEEDQLTDHRRRENFIARIFAYHRLQNLLAGGGTRDRLVRFYAAHEFLLMAHSPRRRKLLGQLVAGMKRRLPAGLLDRYAALYMETLQAKTTPRKNTDVMMHIVGLFKEHLSAGEKQDLLRAIEDYRDDVVSLAVPLSLLKHYSGKLGVDYIHDQVYLNPHPDELALRNHD